jgi:hypothetical protein
MWTTDRLGGAALTLLAIVVIEETWRARLPIGSLHNPGPGYSPIVLALILLAFGVAVYFSGSAAPPIRAVGWSEWRHAAAILGICAISAVALDRLGYRLTVALILGFLLGVLERKSVAVTVVYALVFALGTFYLFDTLLRVPLPRGPFGI